ncbi:MAG TPA: heme o synthase [Candidatus Binataceae bacterium]|nr:heme o synthase [Candidatus Binataceae bacterium]
MSAKSAALEHRLDAARTRAGEYLELTKPRVTAMVLITTLAGYYLGATGSFDAIIALKLLIGTALASGGTLALNQYIERDTDAIMERTRRRPIPDKRVAPREALWFGSVTCVGGLGYLLLSVNALTAIVTAAITISYLFAYTPLKRVSWSCNIIGAVPGALPPVAGWAAARGSLGVEPWLLFGIMYLWQLPHALAIAKMYREDYKRARLWLIPLDRESSYPENPLIVASSIALLLVGAMPALFGFAGIVYLITSLALGCAMLAPAIMLVRGPETSAAARRVMFASLFYLPAVLLVLVLDKF